MIQLNINLLFTIINLLVLYFLMKRFLIGPIMRVMDQRQTMIEEGLENARNSQKEAEELKVKYDENLQHVHVECEAILEDAKKRAQKESERMLQEAQNTAQQIQEMCIRDRHSRRTTLVPHAEYGVYHRTLGDGGCVGG